MDKKIEFANGIKDGIPIALGYFAVSFSFGILALKDGLTALQAVIISLTNVTSAGQFAGLKIIVAGGAIAEMILTQFIINLRYALMSLSLTQKLDKSVTIWQRFIIAFANTDEIFAVAMGHFKEVTFLYMLGLQMLPILGWTGGTLAGAVACDLLPKSVCSALSLALYGMFVAIVVPVAKKSRPVMLVAAVAAILSCVIYYVPFFKFISTGIGIIICTIAAAVVGALFFPVNSKEDDNSKQADAHINNEKDVE
ncbi:MAG: AzlC family ABC transporter permease [Coprococcus sp.]